MRPRSTASSRLAPSGAATAKESTGFLSSLRFVAVGLEIAQDGAFHRGAREIAGCMFRAEFQDDALDRYGFQPPYRGACQLAHLGGVELLGLSGPRQQHSRRRHPGDVVQQRHLQRLPGDLAGVEQIAGAESLFPFSFEYRHNHRAGRYLFQRFPLDRYPHDHKL